MFDDLVNNSALGDSWARWVATEPRAAAQDTREFLSACFEHLPAEKQGPLRNVLKKGNAKKVEATLHELVVHELLRRFDRQPEFEPNLDGLTPDLRFCVSGTIFIADVFVVHSPSKTVKDLGSGVGESWDTSKPSESRAKKISDITERKAGKYHDAPLILFGFQGDHYSFDTWDFEAALYGRTVGELGPSDCLPDVGPAVVPLGGALLPLDDRSARYRDLAALVACDWFDTLNRSDRGRRLYCSVLHHWDPRAALPESAFSPFSQVVWEKTGARSWHPRRIGEGNMLMKFNADGTMRFDVYSSDAPW